MEQTEFTIAEFAKEMKITPEGVRLMIWRDKLPSGFKLVQLSARKRKIVKVTSETTEPPKYKHPSELHPTKIIEIEKCMNNNDFFFKTSGSVNIKKVAEAVNEHYWTIKRFIERDFKKKGENRADKGKSRKLSDKELKKVKPVFEQLFLKNVQGNVKLTIEKTFSNTNIKVPTRLAYKWAKNLKGTHFQKHYFQKFQQRNTPHVIRDLWNEYPNFLDCVVADEWKIDEFGVWVHSLSKNYEQTTALAYIVMFIDMKTRYPLSTVITPHSTTSADSKKAAMQLIREWGKPKQWLFENQKTWKNEDFLRFIFGVYDDEISHSGNTRIEFMNLDSLKTVEQMNDTVIRSTVNHPESKPIERIFKILKDEFCAYSESYSPNQFDSRKPNLGDAHPGVTKTFEELRNELNGFMQHDFLDRERTMFHNRMLSPAHPENKARPKTIREAFNIAYLTFTPDRVQPLKLAYHYAEKYVRKYTNGTITLTYKPLLEKLHFVPLEVDKISNHIKQDVVALIDQYNIYHAWIFSKDGQLLCEAKDMRLFGAMSKERANELGKIKRKITTLNRKKIKAVEEFEKVKVNVFAHEKTMDDPVEEPKELIAETYEDYGFNFETDTVEEESSNNNEDDDLNIFDINIIDF